MRRTGRRDGGAPMRALPTRAWGLPAGSPAGRMAGRVAGLPAGRACPPAVWRVAGFTLVEVLLTLVVLMIGIYAMLRIFPRGYSTIQMTQQRTIAAQLAEGELNRWRLHPEALPDAIVATDYTGALIPSTLTNSSENLVPLLIYGEAAARVAGTDVYDSWLVPPLTLPLLDRIASPLLYSPNDLTPSQFDAVLGFEGLSNHVVIHPNWQPNSLYLPRTVLGEQIDIRRLGTNVRGVPFYLLSHPPLDILRYEGEDLPFTGEDERTKLYVDVYDARPWRYIPSPDHPLADQEFTYDGTTRQLAFGPATPPTYERKCKVDLTCTDPDNPALRRRIFGFTVTVPQSSSVGTEPLFEGTDPTTIQVHERLVALTDDQYQYYMTDNRQLEWPRNAYYHADPEVHPEALVTGMLQFSPLLQVLPQPGDISLAKVDYRVKDWQMLVFDVEVPPDGVVTLPVRALKGPDYTNPPRQDRPQEIAKGIREFFNADGSERPPSPLSAADAYLVAVDRQNGEVLTENELPVGWVANPYERLRRFRVDYRQGQLIFNYGQWEVPDTFSIPLEGNAMAGSQYFHTRSGRTYRVFCRAEGDWAVQFSMASRLYARSSTGRPGDAPLGGATGNTMATCGWDPANDVSDPVERQRIRRQMLFPLSEAGQVVAMDYYTQDGAYVSGEVHSIVGPYYDDRLTRGWVCRLSSELRETPNDWGPVTVRGLSVRARVSWVTPGGGSTLQDWVVAKEEEARTGQPRAARRSLQESWHQMTVTTYLTRVPL